MLCRVANYINTMKILLIAGCNIEYTPVVRAYMEYLDECRCHCEVVEYVPGRRVKFISESIRKLVKNSYEKIVFINFQSLPLALFASIFVKNRFIYWKLESYSAFDAPDLVLKLQLFEWLIPRSRFSLVLPNNQRVDIQRPVFRHVYVLPNAPLRPYLETDEVELKEEKNQAAEQVNFVLYGNLGDSSQFFLDEWVSSVRNSECIRLTVIGGVDRIEPNVNFRSKLPNALLKGELKSGAFLYSIVGYRNTGLNTLYAAPNKLIESLSCGMPIIGHSGNPYVAEIIRKYSCGILVDFNNISLDDIERQFVDRRLHRMNSINAAADLCLMNKVMQTPLRIL